jgi:hypothetical protein
MRPTQVELLHAVQWHVFNGTRRAENSLKLLRDNIMATHISLVQFPDKGIEAATNTTQRVADWAAKVQSMGVRITQDLLDTRPL